MTEPVSEESSGATGARDLGLGALFDDDSQPVDPRTNLETAVIPDSDSDGSSGASGRTRQALEGDDLREQIHRTLQEGGVDSPTRPASAKLSHDQADLLVDLLEGFDSRRALLEWQQDLVIQTVGQLEDGWYTRLAADATTVSALLGEPWGTCDDMRPEIALEVRRGIVAHDLLPAFHAAHSVARWTAVERVDHLDDDGQGDDPEPIDPQEQQYPLMRPAFGELDGQQEAAMERLLEGFESAEQLLTWALQVVGASYAEIGRDTITQAYFEIPIRERLVGTNPTAEDRFIRESWAAEHLLPAFNRAANALAQRAQEVTAGDNYRGETGGGSIT